MSATPYAAVTRTLAVTIDEHAETADPAVVDYMLARAALLDMAHRHGWAKAAEVAYALADELATAGRR